MKKIKDRIHKIKDKIHEIKDKWSSFKNDNYANTDHGKVWLFNILGCVIIGSLFEGSGLPKSVGFLLFSGLAYLGINLLRIIITLILKPIFHQSAKTAVYTLMIFSIILITVVSGSYLVPIPILLIVSIIVTALEILFAKSIWSFFLCKRRSLVVILSLSLTLLLNVVMGLFSLGEGFKDDYIKEYLAYNNQSENNIVSDFYQDTTRKGSLSVSEVEYGINKDSDLEQRTTDLSPYIKNYQGIPSLIRGLYWGYDIDQVPLAGKIWYPSEGGNYPVLFIIHGNHIMTTKSYLGYDYLGEYLASFGYVVISVDEAFCNAYIDFGLSNENDARAILLLENMQLIESYNKDQKNFLYQKMDFNNIALAGHSRGGESVATAALFNHYQYYPDNGNISWKYNFNIKSLIAIAPTCDQYQPAQHTVHLDNINYLLVHGTNDQDVTTLMGYSQYHKISFQKDSNMFKSYVYIAGANHGQFNTTWGRYDLPFPFKPFLNTRNLMDENDQRTILQAYSKVFLDVTLKNDETYKSLFTNQKSYRDDMPSTLYLQNYQDSSFDLLSGFDEDSNIQYGAVEQISLDADFMTLWKEEKNPIATIWNDYVLHLKWKDTKEANYTIALPEYNAADRYLQFDMMDKNQERNDSDSLNFLDATIVLEDSKGNSSSVSMSDYITIYPPLPVKLYKLQFLTDSYDYKLCFQTVRIACSDFEAENKEFDSSSIVNIRFLIDRNDTGEIMMDNIGFSK
jgi:hypothetical protein